VFSSSSSLQASRRKNYMLPLVVRLCRLSLRRVRDHHRICIWCLYLVRERCGVPGPSIDWSAERAAGLVESVLHGDGSKNWPCLVGSSPRMLDFFCRLTTVILTLLLFSSVVVATRKQTNIESSVNRYNSKRWITRLVCR
jgi:hypothetical protein